MSDPLQRIAALLPTLSNAELRVLITVTATPHRSSRAIATAAGLSRNHVQSALDHLEDRGVLASDRGAATRAARLDLQYLEVDELPQVPLGPGCKTQPPLAAKSSHPGCETQPPLAAIWCTSDSSSGCATQPHPRANPMRARAIDFDFDNPIDRLLTANPKKLDDAEAQRTRDWLCGYLRKFGREPNAHPPDDKIVAQFLSVAPWSQLEALLYELMAERKEPGHSYAWFVTVALQRIHGIAPQKLAARRAELKLVKPQSPQPTQQPLTTETNDDAAAAAATLAEVRQLQREMRAMAATKGMR